MERHNVGRREWRDRQRILGIVAVVVLVRVALIAVIRSDRAPTTWEWEVIANNLLAGRGFTYEWLGTTYRSYNPPFFAFLCAAVYAVTGHSHLAMLLVQAVCSGLLAATIWALGCRIATPAVGAIAAALAGLHPGVVYYDTSQIGSLSLDAWVFALIVLLLLRSWERPSRWRLLAAGVTMGVSALCRGSATLFLVPAAAWLAHVHRASWRAAARMAIWLALGMGIVVGPWVVRNCVVHQQFTPWVNTTTGFLLWLGNNPRASGSAHDATGQPLLISAGQELLRRARQHDELGQKAFFEQEAWRFIRETPDAFLRLMVMKFWQFWTTAPQRGLRYPRWYRMGYTAYYVAIASLALIGFAGWWRDPPMAQTRGALVVMGLLALTVSLTHSVFYVEGRHRWGVEPLLLLLASGGLWALARRVRGAIARHGHRVAHPSGPVVLP